MPYCFYPLLQPRPVLDFPQLPEPPQQPPAPDVFPAILVTVALGYPSFKTVALYSLSGKPVVLYFWASWDQPSRKANAEMKILLDKAVKLKPVVYAIGLESYKEPWEDAIRMDGLQNWINVTDYLNLYSSAKSLFNIPDALPYFILLDKDMMIRFKGTNFDALASEINRLGK